MSRSKHTPDFGFFNPNYLLCPVSVVRLRYTYTERQTYQDVTVVYVFGIRFLYFQNRLDGK